jgi:carbonic anhydrase
MPKPHIGRHRIARRGMLWVPTAPHREDPVRMPSPTPRPSEYRRVLEENERFVAQFDRSRVPAPPGRRLAVVACMDARITVEDLLDLRTGDAHVIRNAGGVATDDTIRSLAISHHELGTEEVLVIEHTGCGMLAFTEPELRTRLEEATGTRVDLPLYAFSDLEENLREQVARIREHPWTSDMSVHGLVYEVESGRLRPIE